MVLSDASIHVGNHAAIDLPANNKGGIVPFDIDYHLVRII